MMSNEYLAHRGPGEWKQHKYIRKEGNRYIYADVNPSNTAGLTTKQKNINDFGTGAANNYTVGNADRGPSGINRNGHNSGYTRYNESSGERRVNTRTRQAYDRRAPLPSSGHGNTSDFEADTRAEERRRKREESFRDITADKPSVDNNQTSKGAVMDTLNKYKHKTIKGVGKVMVEARKKLTPLVGKARAGIRKALGRGEYELGRAKDKLSDYASNAKTATSQYVSKIKEYTPKVVNGAKSRLNAYASSAKNTFNKLTNRSQSGETHNRREEDDKRNRWKKY